MPMAKSHSDVEGLDMKGRRFLVVWVCVVSLLILSCESKEKKIESLTIQLNDRSVEVRRAAAVKLSHIGGAAAVPALMKALNDESESVYSVVSETLVKMGEPAIPALIRGLSEISVESFDDGPRSLDVLVQMGEPAVPALVKALDDKNVGIRFRAVTALARIGQPEEVVIDALTKAVHDPENLVCAVAVMALGEIGEPAKRAVPAIANALNSSDDTLRIAADAALAKIGTPEAWEAVREYRYHKIKLR